MSKEFIVIDDFDNVQSRHTTQNAAEKAAVDYVVRNDTPCKVAHMIVAFNPQTDIERTEMP